MADEAEPHELDRALETAVRRTADAQAHVGEVVDEGLIPPVPVVEDVLRRAEDVRDLARELEPTDPHASSGDAAAERRPRAATSDD